MTGTIPKPDPTAFDLDVIVRWRDRAEEFDPEEYGFEDDTYPDDFIHGEVVIASTAYDSYPSSAGELRLRVGSGRTFLRFALDDEPYPGKWGNESVDMGPAIGDQLTARQLIQLMDRFRTADFASPGYVQSELASGEPSSTVEERAAHKQLLLNISTISDAATIWYDAVARRWVETGELVYLNAEGDPVKDMP